MIKDSRRELFLPAVFCAFRNRGSGAFHGCKFGGGTIHIFSEYRRKIVARAKRELHGDVRYFLPLQKKRFGLFDFEAVDISTGSASGLTAEFFLKLGEGKAGSGSQFLQRQFFPNMFLNVGEHGTDIGRKRRGGVRQIRAKQIQKYSQIGSTEAGGGFFLLTGTGEGLLEEEKKRLPGKRTDMTGKTEKAPHQILSCLLIQKKKSGQVRQIKLDPVEFPRGERQAIGIMDFIRVCDKEFSALDEMRLLPALKGIGAVNNQSQLKRIFVNVRRKRGSGGSVVLPSETAHAGNGKLLRRQHDTVRAIFISIFPVNHTHKNLPVPAA